VKNLPLILAILLSVIGIFVQLIFGQQYALNQLFFLIISLAIFLAMTRLDLDWLIKLITPIFFFGLGLLILLLLFTEPIRGAKRWFVLFNYNLQPSIIFLPFFLLFFSFFLQTKPKKDFANFLKAWAYILLPVFLIFKQPDLGSSVVVLITLSSPLYLSNFPLKYYGLIGAFLAPFILAGSRFLKSYQLERITSFLNPQYDPSGINYNSLQSAIAIGSGFIIGKGFNAASQSKLMFLPEAHTDFAFATLVEAFGFLGGILTLSLLFGLFYYLLKQVSNRENNVLYRYYLFGAFAYLTVQTVFNVAMNLRLLPVVGVPLPFVSYGGSNLLSNFILLAIAEKIKEL